MGGIIRRHLLRLGHAGFDSYRSKTVALSRKLMGKGAKTSGSWSMGDGGARLTPDSRPSDRLKEARSSNSTESTHAPHRNAAGK
jgi:hypothetical protein